MKDFSLENIKQRTQKEKSMVDMTCSNIASLFNNSRNKNTNLKDEEKYIYREFEEGEISAKKMIAFLYKCFSPLDKFYYLLFLAVIVFLSVMAVLCTHIIVFPTLIQADSLLLLSAAILLLCVYIGKIIFDSLMEILTKRVYIKAEHSIQYAIIQRIISLSSECLNSFFSDDLGQIVFFAGHSASEFMKASLKSISLCIVSIILLAQISYYAPGLLLPILSIVIVFLILSFSYVRVQKKYIDKESMLEIASMSLAQSTIRGIRKIRLYNSERRAFSWWADSYYKMLYASKNAPLFVKYYKELIRFLELLGLSLIYLVAMYLEVPQGSFYIFLLVYAIVMFSINCLTDNLLILGKVSSSYKSINKFWSAETENHSDRESVDDLQGEIIFTKVKFKYKEDLPYVLDDFSLDIKKGQSIAIVGKTGCGKSTLVRLMMGFERPTQGTIFYDGKDMATLDLQSVRSNIGVVQQEGKLINGSIEENILISNPALSKEDVYKAVKIAGIHEEIMRMPMGYQTIISDESGVISGGQRQRILIARAVVNNPSILIFDEATSALDNITQKRIVDALDELQTTKIIIAHRLSTIKNVDKIILLHDGKIAEQGTYDELIAAKQKFYELIEKQRL